MTLKSDAKFEEKLTLRSKYDMGNLVNFNASNGRSENLHFDVLLLSKVYYVWVIKVQRSHVSYHWRKMQNLRRNWFVFWKMTWGIRRILKQHSKVSKFELWWLVLSKACRALDEKVQKSYVSWHFRVIKRKDNSWEISIFYMMQ